MKDDSLYPCDFVECPSCRDGKRGKATCAVCNGTCKLLAPLCATCEETASQCHCPIPCGKGCAIVNGYQSGPCGRPAIGMVPPGAWGDLELLFDPVKLLPDAFRCEKHLPAFGSGRVEFCTFEGDDTPTLGYLRRLIVDGNPDGRWQSHHYGRLWQPGHEQ